MIEALRAGRSIDKIYVARGETDKTLGHIASKARDMGIVVVEADVCGYAAALPIVLVPLLEIAPDICLPDGRPAKKLLSALACRLDGQDIYQ